MNRAGTDQNLIKCLLEDSLRWNELGSALTLHLTTAKELLNTFKSKEFLFAELMDRHQLCSGINFNEESFTEADYHDRDADNIEETESDESDVGTDDEDEANNGSGDENSDVGSWHMKAPDTEKLDAIIRLMRGIVRFEEECAAGILALKHRTKEMIDLVSITTLVR